MKTRDPKRIARPKARLLADDPRCVYCGRILAYDHPTRGLVPNRYCSIDHLLPVSRGGTDDPRNLVLACSGCNRSKGNRTPDEWAEMIRRAADRLAARLVEYVA